jgi:hypothetical protein
VPSPTVPRELSLPREVGGAIFQVSPVDVDIRESRCTPVVYLPFAFRRNLRERWQIPGGSLDGLGYLI